MKFPQKFWPKIWIFHANLNFRPLEILIKIWPFECISYSPIHFYFCTKHRRSHSTLLTCHWTISFPPKAHNLPPPTNETPKTKAKRKKKLNEDSFLINQKTFFHYIEKEEKNFLNPKGWWKTQLIFSIHWRNKYGKWID